MGIVYEAEQVSLGRHVALKVLPRSMPLDAQAKRRFEREAKSAARLHHTNIVPVFGVGEHDGVPYYVMQFIQGLGLDEVLDELKKLQLANANTATFAGGDLKLAIEARPPGEERHELSAVNVARSLLTGAFDATVSRIVEEGEPPTNPSETPAVSDSFKLSSSSALLSARGRDGSPSRHRKQTYWHSVASIGSQVGDALDYAHKHGIHHRDIKPSNLLLDTQGTVWVTDFGLAKADDQQNLTHTGDILGTLRYMPPEAFDGKSDARSDVYSLGLTLYEMLAFRPAFDEKDRHRLIKQVTTAEPAGLGRLNRQVPRDLETIIHKAIDKDPRQRYASAQDLADDLRRFINDEPIKARRVTAAERLRHWCRRNPLVAGSVAAVVVVFLGAFTAVSAALWDARRARGLADSRREDAEHSEKEALARKAEADRGFAEARKAVDDYLNKVTDGEALRAPGLQPLRRDLLASALTFYYRFLSERRDDPALRPELAAIHLRVSKIQGELGDGAQSRAAAKQAAALFEAVLADSPDDQSSQLGLVESYDRSGDEGKAIALGERVVKAHPDDHRAQATLADAYNQRATGRTDQFDYVGAMEAHERALGLREQAFRGDPTNAGHELGLAATINNIGVLLSRLGRTGDSLALYRRGLDHSRGLYHRQPRDFLTFRLLIRALNNSAIREWDLVLRDEALATNREGLDLVRRLIRTNPDVPEYAYWCQVLAFVRGEWLTDAGAPTRRWPPSGSPPRRRGCRSPSA